MWGETIIGFGQYHYKYESGREGDFLRCGFSPRKAHIVLYLMPGYDDFSQELERLGPYKKGASCLYITRLARIDMAVLEEIIAKDWRLMAEKYPE